MRRLILINLFIDNNWDEEKVLDHIFSIKLNSSAEILNSYHSWGVYEGSSKDYAIVKKKFDPFFRQFLEGKIELAKEILEENVDDLAQINITNFHFVGMSADELRVVEKIPQAKNDYPSACDYKKLNSKATLLEMAQKENLTFPESSLIQLKDFDQLETSLVPFVLKYINSAGGRGVFIINENTKNLISFISRQLEDHSDHLKFLKQEYIDIHFHFYTLADSSNPNVKVNGFKIIYDKHGNSKRHIFEKIISSERANVAEKIGTNLKKRGYLGVFGFDGFESSDGRIYPAIDLNVRHDKARMILNLAEKFNIHKEYFEFRRERFHNKSYDDFDQYWNSRKNELDSIHKKYNDRFYVLPVLFSNFFKVEDQSDMVEISFYTGHHGSESSGYEKWLHELYVWLGIPESLT